MHGFQWCFSYHSNIPPNIGCSTLCYNHRNILCMPYGDLLIVAELLLWYLFCVYEYWKNMTKEYSSLHFVCI